MTRRPPPWSPWEPIDRERDDPRRIRRWPSGARAASVAAYDGIWFWAVRGPLGGVWASGEARTRQGAQRAATAALLRRWRQRQGKAALAAAKTAWPAQAAKRAKAMERASRRASKDLASPPTRGEE